MRYTFFLSWYQISSSPAASSLLPHDTVPRATKICVKPFWLSTLPHSAILFIGSSPHPQALILLKIAPAARTYGLHLCSEAFFNFYFPCGGKKIQTKSRKCTFKVTFFIFLKMLKRKICDGEFSQPRFSLFIFYKCDVTTGITTLSLTCRTSSTFCRFSLL